MKRGKFFSLVVLAMCLLGVFNYSQIGHLFLQNDYKSIEEIDFNTNSDFENRASVAKVQSGFVILEKDTLKFYNAMGILLWTKPLNSQNTLLSTGNHKVVVAEKKAGDVFVLDENGDISASLLGIGAITDVRIFEDKILGVVKSDGNLNIYDEKLNLLGITKLPSGEMIDFEINTEKQDVVMGILDLSRTDFNSKIVIAGFNGNIISGSNLIQDVIFDIHLTSDYMWIITDRQIKLYDYDSQLIKEIDLDRLINVIYYDDDMQKLYLQLTNGESQFDNPRAEQTLVSYDQDGNVLYDIDLTLESSTGMKTFGDKLCLYNENQMVFIESDGKINGNYKGKEVIRDVLLTHDNTFGIVYDNSIEVYVEK